MRREHLIDLDELTLRCQSPGARSGVSEAVACYRAGAFRSCIVATWMAVVWDYVDKIRALDATDDLQARAALKEWETAWQHDNKDKLLELERNVLKLSHEEFELLAPSEKKDLERLLVDRNSCAHPSYSRPEEIFEPTAELARVHLRNAVEHLMQHPPVQGRAAKDRVLSEVESNYFPTSVEEARRWLESGPLARPRDVLVTQVLAVLVKDALIEKFDVNRRKRTFAALQAIRSMQGTLVESWWRDKLGNQLRRIEDAFLWQGIEFLSIFPETWDAWPDDIQTRCKNYVRAIPTDDIAQVLPLAFECPALNEATTEAVTLYDIRVLGNILDNNISIDPLKMPILLLERALAAYQESGSFAVANIWGDRLIPFVIRFSDEDVRALLPVLAKNYQVQGGYTFSEFLSNLRDAGALSLEEFDNLCVEQGLRRFVRRWNPGLESEDTEDAKREDDSF